MKSFTGKFTSVGGWALLLALLLGAGLMISACGDEEVPTPTAPLRRRRRRRRRPHRRPSRTPSRPVPAAPTGLRVTASGHNFLEWGWNAVDGALGYNVQFGANPLAFTDTDPMPQTVAGTSSHRLANLAGNTTLQLRVRTVAGTLQEQTLSDWSSPFMGTTSAPPAAVALDGPGNFRATDETDNSITLEWNEVDDADHYEVEQQVDGASGWGDANCGGEDEDNEVGNEECVASGLDLDTDYNFRVRAIPADDDTRNATGDWTETASSVSTTGTRAPETSSMGEGDLGVTWESEANEITWEWELTDDRDHYYQVVDFTDEQASIDDDTPCPKPTETLSGQDWDTAVRDRRRHSIGTGVPPGSVRLLCVQTMWKDDNDVEQYGNLSWAWAATPPPNPTGGEPEDNENTSQTTDIAWADVALDPGFNYSFSLVSETVDPDGNEAITQDACDEGKSLGTETSDVALGLSAYTVGRPGVYTHNGLCYRAENSSGKSEWAIGDTVRTLPGAPNRPRAADSSLSHDETAITWTVASKAGVPRENENTIGFNTMVITDNPPQDAPRTRTSPNAAKHCTNALDDEDKFTHSPLSGTIATTQDGLELTHAITTNTADTDNSKVYHLCIQAKLSTSRAGPWVVGGSVTQAKGPAPN